MMRILLSAFVAATLLTTSASAGDSADVLTVNGRGTIVLSSSAAISYQQYFNAKCPLILAAHESGGWMTMVTGPDEKCPTEAVDFRRYIYTTLANCEGGWRYGECWIVAIGRKQVWDGAIKFRKGRWTPRGKDQFSVALSGEAANATSGTSLWHTVGLATYRRDGHTADMTFKRHPVFGDCEGEFNVGSDKPASFTVICSKAGQITGALAVNRDGKSGHGAGSVGNAKHYDLTVLPRPDLAPGEKVAETAPRTPSS
jgi:hypothetical protein